MREGRIQKINRNLSGGGVSEQRSVNKTKNEDATISKNTTFNGVSLLDNKPTKKRAQSRKEYLKGAIKDLSRGLRKEPRQNK